MRYRLEIFSQAYEIEVIPKPEENGYHIAIDGQWFDSTELEKLKFEITKDVDSKKNDGKFHLKNDLQSINMIFKSLDSLQNKTSTSKAVSPSISMNILTPKGHIIAPMPGKILKIKVKEGDEISEGQLLLIFEAMKMENEVLSPVSGKILQIKVKKGDSILANQVLLKIQVF